MLTEGGFCEVMICLKFSKNHVFFYHVVMHLILVKCLEKEADVNLQTDSKENIP